MKYLFLLLVVLFISCQRNLISDISKTLGDKEKTEIINNDEVDTEKNIEKLSNNIYLQDARIMMLDFINNPYINKNVIFPNQFVFNNYDEIFYNYGHPVNEIPFTSNDSRYGDNYVCGFVYYYYTINTVYLKSQNLVHVYSIEVPILENIPCKNNLDKNSNPKKIIELFGEPFYINDRDLITEYLYTVPFDTPTIGFQFIGDELVNIIFYFD